MKWASKLFAINMESSSYQFEVDPYSHLLHLYFGSKDKKIHKESSQNKTTYFSGQPDNISDRSYSLDTKPQEYSSFGIGDYRPSSIWIDNNGESQAFEPLFKKIKTFSSVEARKRSERCYGPLLPHFHNPDKRVEITLLDPYSNVQLTLEYDFFCHYDVVERGVKITNLSDKPITINKLSSLTLDIPSSQDLDLIHFHGKWGYERQFERVSIPYLNSTLSSSRGQSSLQENPTLILAQKNTNEWQGECVLFSFLFSSDFLIDCFREQTGGYRVNVGMNPETFSLTLKRQESFQTPLAIIGYSNAGFSSLSIKLHRLIKQNLLLPRKKDQVPYVLLNSWEGSYFSFDGHKLVKMAKESKDMGCNLFVLDDGWFLGRNDDHTSLGDWTPDKVKLGCSLDNVAYKIEKEGMRFGIWFEPEMVSPDSHLFKEHPDWAVTIKGRVPCLSRSQLLLDMSKKEVRTYLYKVITKVLMTTKASYLKWDFNRSMSDRPGFNHGSFTYDYLMGTYALLHKIHLRFPTLLIETCSGGGGRFDLGMLYFSHQIWCSDNTDAISRAYIEYGTSFLYPPCTMGAHVGISPSAWNESKTSLQQRYEVAALGSFGYELDPKTLTDLEKGECKRMSHDFASIRNKILDCDFLRLTSPYESNVFAYEFISRDHKWAYVSYTILDKKVETQKITIYPRLLLPNSLYRYNETAFSSSKLCEDGIEFIIQKTSNKAGHFLLEFISMAN